MLLFGDTIPKRLILCKIMDKYVHANVIYLPTHITHNLFRISLMRRVFLKVASDLSDFCDVARCICFRLRGMERFDDDF